MKRYHFLLIIVALMLSVVGVVAAQSQEQEKDIFGPALNVAGADLESVEIHYHTRLHEQPATVEQSQEKVLEIASRLGVREEERTVTVKEYAASKTVAVRGPLSGGGEAKISLQYLAQEDDAHLFLCITDEGPAQKTLERGKRLLTIFSGVGEEGNVSVSVNGTVPAHLSKTQMNAYAQSIVRELNGEIKEGIQEGNLVSVTAYSPSINTAVFVNDGEPVNLNVALRHDSRREVTNIWVGVPLIESAY